MSLFDALGPTLVALGLIVLNLAFTLARTRSGQDQ
jgi:hypothetical protein